MPLPFLKPKQMAVQIMVKRKPDESDEGSQDAGDDSGLRAAAADLIRSIGEGNEEGVAAAIRAAFTVLESEPHEEGPHEDMDTE